MKKLIIYLIPVSILFHGCSTTNPREEWVNKQISIFKNQNIETSLENLGKIPETEDEYSIELGRIGFSDGNWLLLFAERSSHLDDEAELAGKTNNLIGDITVAVDNENNFYYTTALHVCGARLLVKKDIISEMTLDEFLSINWNKVN